jgi:alkylhydroperoxidase family enzyme
VTKVRLPPLPRERWDEKAEAAMRAGVRPDLADRYFIDGPDHIPMPNVLATLAHHPTMAKRFLAYNYVLLYGSSLDDRLRELMILRVAWRTRSAYEWAQHANMAADSGITTAEVESIVDGAAAECWTPIESALLDATDQLIDHYRIDDNTWSLLAKEFDERQLVEITFVVGTYTCLAMAFNSFGLELEPELEDASVPALPAAKE